MWDAICNLINERWWGRGKPQHFDRLRWWTGWHGGSRGKVLRMRAKSRVPVVVGMEVGKGPWTSLAGGTGFHCASRPHAKNFLALLYSAEGASLIRWGGK